MFAKPSFFTKTLERCPERGEHRLERERGRERERERERENAGRGKPDCHGYYWHVMSCV